MASPLAVIDLPSDVIPHGPIGGAGGAPFYDGVGDAVNITITYSADLIWSLQVDYRQKDSDRVFAAAQHGSKGPILEKISLKFLQGERLLQVKGTTASARIGTFDAVTSLIFITTEKTHGPFGAEIGRPFHSSVNGQVVGFFGRSGRHIHAIGTFTDFAHPATDVAPDGPWGGSGGGEFYDSPAVLIKQIDVEFNDAAIISLNVKYDRGNLGFQSSSHGKGDIHGTISPIYFSDSDYLAQVKGTFGQAYGNLTVVTSLEFITSGDHHYRFGNVSGTPFETMPHAQILGFYGRSGWLIDQLGAFIGTMPSYLAVRVPDFGGQGGDAFYEGRGEISKIVVTYLEDQLVAKLQVTYLQGGLEFEGALHGGADGDMSGKIASINLSAGEYLVRVKGTHGTAKGVKDLILSIEFITNKKAYGPYGNPHSGTPFASPEVENLGKIVGLFGRSGYWLDQIGVIIFNHLIV